MQRGKNMDGPHLIIVGLGNPGVKYSATRHNAGWWVLDELERRSGAGGSFNRHQSSVRQCEIQGRKALLVRPQTYMNVSGEAVAAWRREHPETPWILVYDDTSLPPGELRLKRSGSAGGHNGVQSVVERLKSQQFDRLKIGIGPPPHPGVLADYVLGVPGSSDLALITPAIVKAAEALELLAVGGFDKAAQFASGGEAKQEQRRKQRAAQSDGPDGASSPPEADPNS